MKREDLLNFIINAVVFGLIFMLCSCKAGVQQFNSDEAWKNADDIIANIIVPQFPDKVFNIKDFGAKADGVSDNSDAFKKAITACNESGGGKVLVPEGEYLTGPIHLKSNVNLHLVKRFSLFISL